jgi:hypothetical protein
MRPLCLLMLALVAALPQRADFLKRPFGPANPLVSPDGAWSLIGIFPDSQLWIEDNRTHQRRLVMGVTVQTMTLAWAPDSSAFVVNDRPVSNFETACLYDVKTLHPLDLRRRIFVSDPSAIPFLDGQIALNDRGPQVNLPSGKNADHQFVHATRWLDVQHVEVDLNGHTDSVMADNRIDPSDCFVLHYRIDRTGAVTRLSRRIYPVPPQGCNE